MVGGRNVAYKGPAAEGTVVLLDQQTAGGVGFNDLVTDAAGRLYVGSLGASPFDPEAEQRAGFLHLIDLDGSSRVLAGDILLTNGLGFSPDGKRLYHSDSRRQIVGVYEVREDGSVSERSVFADIDDGSPDGLAVAQDGTVWVAGRRWGEGADLRCQRRGTTCNRDPSADGHQSLLRRATGCAISLL